MGEDEASPEAGDRQLQPGSACEKHGATPGWSQRVAGAPRGEEPRRREGGRFPPLLIHTKHRPVREPRLGGCWMAESFVTLCAPPSNQARWCHHAGSWRHSGLRVPRQSEVLGEGCAVAKLKSQVGVCALHLHKLGVARYLGAACSDFLALEPSLGSCVEAAPCPPSSVPPSFYTGTWFPRGSKYVGSRVSARTLTSQHRCFWKVLLCFLFPVTQ